MGTARWWGVALGATAWALGGATAWRWQPSARRAPAGASPDGVCALALADRAATPVARCLSCHDGTVGRSVATPARGGNTPGYDHPVDLDYARVQARNARLAPRAALPREVVLVDGKVVCTTCHDAAAAGPARTVKPQRGLCFGCHLL